VLSGESAWGSLPLPLPLLLKLSLSQINKINLKKKKKKKRLAHSKTSAYVGKIRKGLCMPKERLRKDIRRQSLHLRLTLGTDSLQLKQKQNQ